VYRDLPYYTTVGNVAESFQGLFLIWETALLMLASSVPQAVLAPGLLLLLGIPTLLAINFSIITFRSRTFLSSGIQSEAMHAKAIYISLFQASHTANSEEISLENTSLASFKLEKLSIYPLLWTAYYNLRTENMYFAKLAIGLVREKDKNWRNAVQIGAYMAHLYAVLHKNQEEKTLQNFLLLNRFLSKVREADYFSSVLSKAFYEGLERKNVSFVHLVNISKLLSRQINYTIAGYERIVQTFPKRASLQAAYSSFLQMIGKAQAAKDYKEQAFKLTERKRKRVTSGADRLVHDDPNVVLLVVPMTGPEKWKIAWSVNASLLDYTDDELKGRDCSVLLPEAFRAKHREMLEQLPTKRTLPQIIDANFEMNIYVRNSKKKLLCGVWRVFFANDRDTGDLMFVTSIRIEHTPKDFAIINSFGELMERTPEFEVFTQETSFLSECDLLSNEVVWKGQWRGSLFLASKDIWHVSDRFEIASISLFKMRSKRGASLGKSTLAPRIPSSTTIMETNILHISHVSSIDAGAALRSTCTLREKEGKRVEVNLNRTKSKIKWLGRGLIILLILAFLSGSIVALVVEETFSSSVLEVNKSIAYITSIGMRVLSARAAIRSKELYLLSTGFRLYGNETAARIDLNAVAGSFRTMKSYLYGNSSSAIGGYRELLLEPITPFWRYESDHFVRYQLNLLDLMDEISRRTGNLANCSLGNITRDNSDFMTLYRNGAAEALGAFNSSVRLYGESKNEERDKVLSAMKLMAVIIPLMCLIIFTPLLAGLLFSLERNRKEVWKWLFSLPINVIIRSRELVNSRMESLQQEEFVSSQNITFTQAYHYKSSIAMKVLRVSVLVYCCAISLSGLGLYLYGYSTMSTMLLYKPVYTDWLGMRRAGTAKSWFHMREAWLPANLTYSAIIPNTQTFHNHLTHWEQASGLVTMAHKCITLGCEMHNLNNLFPSDTHKDLLMGNGLGNASAVSAAGLSPFLNEIYQLSSAARADLRAGLLTDYSKGKKLEKYISLAFSAITLSNQQSDMDTADQLQAADTELKRISIAVVCVAFLVLILELFLLHKVSTMLGCEKHQKRSRCIHLLC
jgi:hypothetical protein